MTPNFERPAAHLTPKEKWLHYKRLEVAVKKELQLAAGSAQKEVADLGGYADGVMLISKVTRKPLDSLKTLLAGKGYLDLCIKDEIDLSKVQSLVDAGLISQNEVDVHIKSSHTSYLKVK